jgi:hypothetical protein
VALEIGCAPACQSNAVIEIKKTDRLLGAVLKSRSVF